MKNQGFLIKIAKCKTIKLVIQRDQDDAENSDEFKNVFLNERCKPLNITGKVIEIDTTEFEKVDFERVIEQIRESL